MGVSGEVGRRTLLFEGSTDSVHCQVFYHSVLRSNGMGIVSPDESRSCGKGRHSQGERFDGPNRVFSIRTIGEHAGQLRDFSDPAAVFFAVGFDLEVVRH
jgi:hypothetical protein